MTYKLTHEGYVIRDGDTKIPIVDTLDLPNTNPDYLAYKEWLAAGNIPEPADPLPTVVPAQITSRQGKLALLHTPYNEQVTMLDAVEALLDNIQNGKQRRAAAIEYSNYIWERSNPTLQNMWAALGKSPEELDQMFILAATF